MHTRTHAATYLAACSLVVIDSSPTHTHTNTDLHTQTHTQKWIQIYRRGEFGRDLHSVKKMESRQK